MKKYIALISFTACVTLSVIQSSCSVTEKLPKSISDKTGAQLWGENCGRCHNAPGPGEFSDYAWDVIGLHMRTRANLTETETEKIVTFLKDGNAED